MPPRKKRSPEATLQWVKPPQQDRSRKTMERLLDAAEKLLLERGVEGTNIALVARKARSSVGAFYARFQDKEGLLRAVSERFAHQSVATIKEVVEPARWEGQSLPVALRLSIGFMIQAARERRVLMSSLMNHATQDATLARMIDRVVEDFADLVYRFLEARRELPDHPSPRLAVRVMVMTLLATAHVRILRPADVPPPIEDAELTEELVRMCLAQLGQHAALSAPEAAPHGNQPPPLA